MSASNWLLNNDLNVKFNEIETKTIITQVITTPPESNLALESLQTQDLNVSNSTTLQGDIFIKPEGNLIAPNYVLKADNSEGKVKWVPESGGGGGFDPSDFVDLVNNQTIGGVKTFTAQTNLFSVNTNAINCTADCVISAPSLKISGISGVANGNVLTTDASGNCSFAPVSGGGGGGGAPNNSLRTSNNTIQSIGDFSTPTYLNIGTKHYDPANVWSIGTSTITYTGTSGVFLINSTVNIEKIAVANAYFQYGLLVNGNPAYGGSSVDSLTCLVQETNISTYSCCSTHDVITLNSGDTLRFVAQASQANHYQSLGVIGKALVVNIIRVA